ncbi:MAG: membrane protein insertion efficiency factor YidD [Candidatus Neomarinimicrobiota bacterium]|nr:membrane protein insertion efficiency factor YidD [Candidatus Neomarinimicrobiota bacterium]
MRQIILIIFIATAFGQIKYPADSLLKSSKISVLRKAALLPIAGWQRISYNTDLFNCQFYPSCSNYSAEAIKEHGLVLGCAVAADRIIRCNPAAFHYHVETQAFFNDDDGRLIDFVKPKVYQFSKKSPSVAAGLSIVPGLGRIYAGRLYDGLFSFLTLSLSGKAAYTTLNQKRPLAGPLFTAVFMIAYLGEIYGGWRSAKYYQAAVFTEPE